MFVAPLLAACAAFAPQDEGSAAAPDAAVAPAAVVPRPAPPPVVEAAAWTGAELLDPEGRGVGRLADLVADVTPGRVRYLVIQEGAGTLHALPSPAVAPVDEGVAGDDGPQPADSGSGGRHRTLRLASASLEASGWPVMDAEMWPDEASYKLWRAYGSEAGTLNPFDRPRDGAVAYRVSSLPGVNVRLADADADVGVIEGVWLRPDLSRLAAFVVRLQDEEGRAVGLRPADVDMESLENDIFLSIRADAARLAAAPALPETDPAGNPGRGRVRATPAALAELTRYWSGGADGSGGTAAGAVPSSEPAAADAGR